MNQYHSAEHGAREVSRPLVSTFHSSFLHIYHLFWYYSSPEHVSELYTLANVPVYKINVSELKCTNFITSIMIPLRDFSSLI